MRGSDAGQEHLFSYLTLEDRVPEDHPLRKLRGVVNGILETMGPQFNQVYAEKGRPSIAPERLFRALLLQCLYSVRSERQLVEQIEYNLLFRWFVGLRMDEGVWDASTFSANRDRLLNETLAREFFRRVAELAQWRRAASQEHFSVDGTLIAAWASHKSVKPKEGGDDGPSGGGRNTEVDFRGTQRRNDTHASTTDPEARLYRKSQGTPAQLGYLAHALTENRNGLIVDAELTQASGTAERDAAKAMIERSVKPDASVGGDKAYDTRAFVAALRQRRVRAHVAQNTTNRRSAIDRRTTRHAGYAISQRRRKLIEEGFGWSKTVGGLRKTRFIGRTKVAAQMLFTFASYNLVRLIRILQWGNPQTAP